MKCLVKSFKLRVGDVTVKVKGGGLTSDEAIACKVFSFDLMSIVSAPPNIREQVGNELARDLSEIAKRIRESAISYEEV